MKQPPSTEHVPRIRSFIAVNLPAATIQKVGGLQDQLRDRARDAGLKVGWVPLTGMHLTLKFLAEIPEESVWAVRDLLRDRLAGRSGFWVRVKGVGAFPSRERPRVLWAGLEDGEELVRLAADLESWLEELGFARESRPFHPHLTLGRVKAGSGDILAGLEATDFGECAVVEVVLYRSVLRRQGAEYTPLARSALLRPATRAAAAASVLAPVAVPVPVLAPVAVPAPSPAVSPGADQAATDQPASPDRELPDDQPGDEPDAAR